MRRRSFVTAVALVLGLALGVAVGPSLRAGVANAQTTPQGQTTTGTSLRSLFLDKLAAALNIQRATLDSAITTAGTETADAAVQQGTLTQPQADALKQRAQQDGIWAFGGGRGGKLRGAHVAGIGQAMLDAAAQALGITADELKTQLRSGQTLAQLAAAHNTTEQAVTDAALAAAKTKLDEAVQAGTLTQAQADSIYAELQQRGLNFAGKGPGRGGNHGRRGAPASPEASPAPSTSGTST